MKFAEHLNSLRKGERNASLVALMLRGLGEKMDPQEIVNAIQAVHADLSEGELRHAMATAQGLKRDYEPSVERLRIAKAAVAATAASEDERNFVKDTIAKCGRATSGDLMRMSPIEITDATPREQAMAYVATVFPDDRHYVFTATEDSKFHRRTYDTLAYPSRLFRRIADGAEIPNYAIANQFTGLPDDAEKAIDGDDFDTFHYTGEGSFACTKTLATRRLALLEFDELPLADQARFWVAAIEGGVFGDRLRTLVYSGMKSIHALIRVDSAEISGFHEEEDCFVADYADDPIARWKCERAKLSRITENGESPYNADRACKDPTRLTRFAGAVRACKDGKRRVQRLLWCAQPTDFDIPTHPDCGATFYSKGFGLNGEYYKC